MATTASIFGAQITELKRNQARNTSLLQVNVSAATTVDQAMQSPITLPAGARGLLLMSVMGDESGNVLTSSATAAVMVRINGRGPWLPFSLGGWQAADFAPYGNQGGRGAWSSVAYPGLCRYVGLIYQIEAFVIIPDNDPDSGDPFFNFLLLHDADVSPDPGSSGGALNLVRAVGGGGGIGSIGGAS